MSRKATLAEARVLLMVCCRAGPDSCHFGKSVAKNDCTIVSLLRISVRGWLVLLNHLSIIVALHFDNLIIGCDGEMEVRSAHVTLKE